MSESPLDIEQHDQLIAYLRDAGRIERDEPPPQCRTLAGGVSNRTVWVRRESGEEWVLKQALAKLRVQVDWFSDPARVHREALGLKWLEKLAPPGTITPLIFEDQEHHLLAMAAVLQPHENWKTMLLRGEVNQRHVSDFARMLGTIHRNAAATSEPLAQVFDDSSFFESLRVEPYYAYSAIQVPEAAAFINALIADTRRRRHTLVHGDYSPKNILVYDDQLVLLDHEVIHWGDPMFDVGFALTHFLSKGHHLPQVRREFVKSAAGFAVNYQHFAAGLWDEAMAVRHTLGCLLGRVAGRSLLEYLVDQERNRQRRAVLALIREVPRSMTDLISGFFFGADGVDVRD